MSEGESKPKWVTIHLKLSPRADEVLRAHSPRQGDKSKIVNGLILDNESVLSEILRKYSKEP